MPSLYRHGLLRIALLCALFFTFRAAARAQSKGEGSFSDTQLAFVKGWIMERAPECPADIAGLVATQFLDDLQSNHPASFEQLMSPGFQSSEFESTLLRDIASHLTGPSWVALKERLAVRRVRFLTAKGDSASAGHPEDPAAIVARIRASSDIHYRRLLDGKIEDDDLSYFIKRGAPGSDVSRSEEDHQQRPLTADEIVADFSRHNQEGAALQKIQAYVIEGDVESQANGIVHLLMFKLRRDYVRVVVMKDGLTRSVIAGHDGAYWRQVPGGPPSDLGKAASTEMDNVGEFADPLFAEEAYIFTRLPDGAGASGAFYRIGVKRPNGSGFVAHIDPSNLREIGRDEENGSTSSNSDFRSVAGVIIPFRQESTDAKGAKTVFRVSRFTPNSGVTEVMFLRPGPRDQGYFEIERLLAASDPVNQHTIK